MPDEKDGDQGAQTSTKYFYALDGTVYLSDHEPEGVIAIQNYVVKKPVGIDVYLKAYTSTEGTVGETPWRVRHVPESGVLDVSLRDKEQTITVYSAQGWVSLHSAFVRDVNDLMTDVGLVPYED